MSRAFFLFFVVFSFVKGWAQDPSILYLTWKDDPTTTMTVMWHTVGDPVSNTVYYKPLQEDGWKQKTASSVKIEQSNVQVHQVELTELKADSEYTFHLGGEKKYKFRTLPQFLNKPVKVAVGGDIFLSKELYEKMNREVASHDPDFAILGGDIAYTEGLRNALRSPQWRVDRWEEFFRIWTRDMVTKEGRMIPLMPIIGSHDIREGFDNPFKNQVLFYEMFAFPKKGIPYQAMRVGLDICFYLLDTGNSRPIAGAQTEWLKQAFKDNKRAIWQIPVYHDAAYPSETAFNSRTARNIRKFWSPIFEENGVFASMENGNHTFKRTYPIKEGKVNPKGVYYLGDGCWGVPPLKPERHWYLDKSARTSCFWLITIDPTKCLYEAFDNEGRALDRLEASR